MISFKIKNQLYFLESNSNGELVANSIEIKNTPKQNSFWLNGVLTEEFPEDSMEKIKYYLTQYLPQTGFIPDLDRLWEEKENTTRNFATAVEHSQASKEFQLEKLKLEIDQLKIGTKEIREQMNPMSVINIDNYKGKKQ